jgi:hypothetical protein
VCRGSSLWFFELCFGGLCSLQAVGPTPKKSHLVSLLTVKFRQPSHEFAFSVGMTFISYPLVLTPLV